MSESNGNDSRLKRQTFLPIWVYLVLGFLIVGLIRLLDWLDRL